MPEATTKATETRRSRYFLYQDGKHVVMGRQFIRYEPDVGKKIFGTAEVQVYFPKRTQIKNGFPLDLFPEPHDRPGDDMTKNIVNVEDGCRLMFIEANKTAALQSRMICKIKQDEFDYKNLTILTEDKVTPKGYGFTVAQQFILRGVVTQDYEFLRKGDILMVGDCGEIKDEKEAKIIWHCMWDPLLEKKTLKNKIRRLWYKFGKNNLYKKRYYGSTIIDLDPKYVRVTTGDAVEPETTR